MQIQKGTVIAVNTNDTIKVTGLTFIPDIVIVRIISDVSGVHSLVWVYTPYANLGIRTDSDGISKGISSAGNYIDKGYNIGRYNSFNLIDGGFKFASVNDAYAPIQANDQFEWTAIKYL